jgi:hypothetical protein
VQGRVSRLWLTVRVSGVKSGGCVAATDARVRLPNGVYVSQEAPDGGHACCFGNHGQLDASAEKERRGLFDGTKVLSVDWADEVRVFALPSEKL